MRQSNRIAGDVTCDITPDEFVKTYHAAMQEKHVFRGQEFVIVGARLDVPPQSWIALLPLHNPTGPRSQDRGCSLQCTCESDAHY